MLLFTEKGDNRVITRLGELRSPKVCQKDTLGIQMETSLKKADISTRGLRKNGVRDINLEVISTWKVFKAPSGGKKSRKKPCD